MIRSKPIWIERSGRNDVYRRTLAMLPIIEFRPPLCALFGLRNLEDGMHARPGGPNNNDL
jgi:hypothetical protein